MNIPYQEPEQIFYHVLGTARDMWHKFTESPVPLHKALKLCRDIYDDTPETRMAVVDAAGWETELTKLNYNVLCPAIWSS